MTKSSWFGATLLVAGALTLAVSACGSPSSNGDGKSVCSPGTQKACACPGGTSSVQNCMDDGSRWDVCQACPLDGGTGGSGGKGSGGSSQGGHGGGGAGSGGATAACADGRDCPGYFWCVQGICQDPAVLWEPGRPLPTRMRFVGASWGHVATDCAAWACSHQTIELQELSIEIDEASSWQGDATSKCKYGSSTEYWNWTGVLLKGHVSLEGQVTAQGGNDQTCTVYDPDSYTDPCWRIKHCSYAPGSFSLEKTWGAIHDNVSQWDCEIVLVPFKRKPDSALSTSTFVSGLIAVGPRDQGFLYSVRCSDSGHPHTLAWTSSIRFDHMVNTDDCKGNEEPWSVPAYHRALGSFFWDCDKHCTECHSSEGCDVGNPCDTRSIAAEDPRVWPLAPTISGLSQVHAEWQVRLQSPDGAQWPLWEANTSYDVSK